MCGRVLSAGTTTVANRVLTGEQEPVLTVECTKPARFRQTEGVTKERVEAIHEKLLADRNRRIEVTNQEYDHPTSTHCEFGGCSLAGRKKLNTCVLPRPDSQKTHHSRVRRGGVEPSCRTVPSSGPGVAAERELTATGVWESGSSPSLPLCLTPLCAPRHQVRQAQVFRGHGARQRVLGRVCGQVRGV